MICEKIKIAFSDTCEVGKVDLSTGFEFSVNAKVMEQEGDYSEEAAEDAYGLPSPLFQRFNLIHVLSTELIPTHLVDVFRLLRFCDTVTITDRDSVYGAVNIEVDVIWLFDEKQYARVDMRFQKDEALTKGRCCLSLTEETILLSSQLTSSNVTCNGADDGEIVFGSILGGSGNYEASIDGGATWQDAVFESEQWRAVFSGLAPATYQPMLRDKDTTTTVFYDDIIITEPVELFADPVVLEHCWSVDDDNGRVGFSSFAGATNYEMRLDAGAWQDMGDSVFFQNLEPAVYNVYIRDKDNPSCEVQLADITILATLRGEQTGNCQGALFNWNAYNPVDGLPYDYKLQYFDGDNWIDVAQGEDLFSSSHNLFVDHQGAVQYRVQAFDTVWVTYGTMTLQYTCTT